jgi:hypothetical protein
MSDGTPLGVRVQEAFMAAVLVGPTTKTTTTFSSFQTLYNAVPLPTLQLSTGISKPFSYFQICAYFPF